MSRRGLRSLVPAIVGAVLLLGVFSVGAPSSVVTARATSGSGTTRLSPDEFNKQMRKLWEDHITWTRLFIVSAAAGLPDQSPTADRLFQNQVDIGNFVKPFYGDAAGDHLTSLLRDHIALAAQIIADAKAGNSTQEASDIDAWFANADEIAHFLNSLNPRNWPLAEMQDMMKMHLNLTLQEAVDRLQGNFTADIADYEQVHLEILTMADTLSDGIVAQFPARFIDDDDA
jgi:hypothetical protein